MKNLTTRRLSLFLALIMVLTMCSTTAFAADTIEDTEQTYEIEYVLEPGQYAAITPFGSGSVGVAPSSGTTYSGSNFTADGTKLNFTARATDAVGNVTNCAYAVSLIKVSLGVAFSTLAATADGSIYYCGTTVTNGHVYRFDLINRSSQVLYIKVSYTIS